MLSEEENLSELLKTNFIRMLDGIPIRSCIEDETIDQLKAINPGKHNVIVAGYAKSGSHFVLQILSQLGYKRMYGKSSSEGTIDSTPIERQSAGAIRLMGKIALENPNTNYVLNHSHAYPFHLPTDKVKIIYISRDPRAIATSGYHFFGGLEEYQPVFDTYQIKNIDDFARIIFQGKMSYGSVKRFDDAWRQCAAENAQVHCVTFEDLKLETERNVKEIAEFLELDNIDIKHVVKGSQFESKDIDFKNPGEDDRSCTVLAPDNSACLVKRKGKIDSWKSELSEDSLKYYRQYFE